MVVFRHPVKPVEEHRRLHHQKQHLHDHRGNHSQRQLGHDKAGAEADQGRFRGMTPDAFLGFGHRLHAFGANRRIRFFHTDISCGCGGAGGKRAGLLSANRPGFVYGDFVKLLLIDGPYYVYRSFFAIRELSNSRGEPTNAIYGFVKVLRKMLRDLQPDRAAVLWDEGLPHRRTQLQPEYKQQRAEMPELMRPQIAHIRKLAPLMGIASLRQPDTEADDLIATYACEAARHDMEVVLATNDKDLFQLVDDRVKVYSTNKADFASPKDGFALLGGDYVREKWGVEPKQIGDVLCLVGDASDNIPGVAGLGPKRAAALIKEFGGITQLLMNVKAVQNETIREKIESSREQILSNQEMVRLDTHLPLPAPMEELCIRPRYTELLGELEPWEFKSLMEEIRLEAAGAVQPRQGELF